MPPNYDWRTNPSHPYWHPLEDFFLPSPDDLGPLPVSPTIPDPLQVPSHRPSHRRRPTTDFLPLAISFLKWNYLGIYRNYEELLILLFDNFVFGVPLLR